MSICCRIAGNRRNVQNSDTFLVFESSIEWYGQGIDMFNHFTGIFIVQNLGLEVYIDIEHVYRCELQRIELLLFKLGGRYHAELSALTV